MRTDTSGTPYIKAETAAADAARRMETASKVLTRVYLQVTTQSQSFGTAAAQTYVVAAGSSITFDNIDISTLYFKNTTPGQNGTVTAIGVLA